ncbi:hypothetical protein [Bradyrhizobium sp.]|uniref:hypothetical protein n=2 Tax=Bradyrhizobium sp. TaxID=376 RepID=UPI00290EB610|nr:hypothetical protein [Bradyrhizobium sp.]MDU6373203.1 hypothetical protein [Bradyrhizobium sp.]MDU6489732.1 hypothetical protein [Bradyrhizobium sp.]MDU6831838.1 hypothetical protein [Bradyrhizobium sp.]
MADLGGPFLGNQPQFVEADIKPLEQLRQLRRQRRRRFAETLLRLQSTFEQPDSELSATDMGHPLSREIAQIEQAALRPAQHIEAVGTVEHRTSRGDVLMRAEKVQAAPARPEHRVQRALLVSADHVDHRLMVGEIGHRAQLIIRRAGRGVPRGLELTELEQRPDECIADARFIPRQRLAADHVDDLPIGANPMQNMNACKIEATAQSRRKAKTRLVCQMRGGIGKIGLIHALAKRNSHDFSDDKTKKYGTPRQQIERRAEHHEYKIDEPAIASALEYLKRFHPTKSQQSQGSSFSSVRSETEIGRPTQRVAEQGPARNHYRC